jgi:hypothetical protein
MAAAGVFTLADNARAEEWDASLTEAGKSVAAEGGDWKRIPLLRPGMSSGYEALPNPKTKRLAL